MYASQKVRIALIDATMRQGGLYYVSVKRSHAGYYRVTVAIPRSSLRPSSPFDDLKGSYPETEKADEFEYILNDIGLEVRRRHLEDSPMVVVCFFYCEDAQDRQDDPLTAKQGLDRNLRAYARDVFRSMFDMHKDTYIWPHYWYEWRTTVYKKEVYFKIRFDVSEPSQWVYEKILAFIEAIGFVPGEALGLTKGSQKRFPLTTEPMIDLSRSIYLKL